MRVWLSTFARAGQTDVIARTAESAGFYGLTLTDSQCLVADPFVELAAVADATHTLQLGTCASNLVTRHPTVVAAMATTLQERSGGRMHLGIARGDSALSKVGLHPLTIDDFGAALADVRRLVQGDDATIAWRDPAIPPTPIIGVASGPHAIEAVARNADGLILQVGSDPAAIERGLSEARAAQRSDDFTVAAYVIVGLVQEGIPDTIDAVSHVLARMATSALADDDSPQARASAVAAQSYDVATHGLAEGQPEVEDYAVRGDAAGCTAALQRIAATGCDELIVILGSATTPMDELLDLIAAFGDSVLPTLTAA